MLYSHWIFRLHPCDGVLRVLRVVPSIAQSGLVNLTVCLQYFKAGVHRHHGLLDRVSTPAQGQGKGPAGARGGEPEA